MQVITANFVRLDYDYKLEFARPHHERPTTKCVPRGPGRVTILELSPLRQRQHAIRPQHQTPLTKRTPRATPGEFRALPRGVRVDDLIGVSRLALTAAPLPFLKDTDHGNNAIAKRLKRAAINVASVKCAFFKTRRGGAFGPAGKGSRDTR
jgi:hypothetical protein